MGFRWVVNAGLLALPIGATVGILLGVDSHRQATGQEPLFTPDPNSGSGGIIPGIGGTIGGGGSKNDDGITEARYCQKQAAITPPSQGSKYTLNPNQWGWTEGTLGSMCMNITAFHNGSYATSTTAPEFFVTWQYPPGPENQPVHAFPNIQIAGKTLPVKLSTLQRIDLATEWTYGIGDEPVAKTDEAALALNNVQTNVAVDMFLDADKTTAQNTSKAAYEVMVWLAGIGDAAQPIGLKAGVVTTESLNGTTFNLYTGKNGFDQNVLTWVSAAMMEQYTGDIAPLITRLATLPNVDFPLATLYLGELGMGSEAFSSNVNVTFSVPVFSVDLIKA